MKAWVTKISAIDPIDGQIKEWFGPYVNAETERDATAFCQTNGLGYCRIAGQLVSEADEDTGVRIDFDNLN